jgi:hypothetical protein
MGKGRSATAGQAQEDRARTDHKGAEQERRDNEADVVGVIGLVPQRLDEVGRGQDTSNDTYTGRTRSRSARHVQRGWGQEIDRTNRDRSRTVERTRTVSAGRGVSKTASPCEDTPPWQRRTMTEPRATKTPQSQV